MKFELPIIDDILRNIKLKYEEEKEGAHNIKAIYARKCDDIVTIWITSPIEGREISVMYRLEDGKTEEDYEEEITQLLCNTLDREFEDMERGDTLSEILEDMEENVRISYKGKEPRVVLELIYRGDRSLVDVFDTVRRTGGVTGRVGNKLKSSNILPGLGEK